MRAAFSASTCLLLALWTGLPGPAAAARRDGAVQGDPMAAVLARAAQKSGQWDAAARLWRDVTLADPGDGPAWAALGEALARLGNGADSVAALERAAELEPVLPGLASSLGRAQLLQGNGAAAAAAFGTATRAKPGDPTAWTGLGIALDLQGDHAGAQAAYGRALRIDPLHRAARHNLALSLELARHAAPGGAP